MTTLYKISNTGAIQVWTIEELRPDLLRILWGQQGGAMQTQTEVVEVNQSGRSLTEQMFSRMESRINKQKDKGYSLSLEQAYAQRGRNAAGLLKPMLAQTYDPVKHSLTGKKMQWKYDGHRCLITNDGGENIAYSRNGKPITTIDHILHNIIIPKGATLDGELYIHGAPLQEISSIVRREQLANRELQYIAYDTVSDRAFLGRYEELFGYKLCEDVVIAELLEVPDQINNAYLQEKALGLGYEGFILREQGKGYECGKRSSQLLKIKQSMDAEFMVIAVHESKDGWAILECTDGSVDFRVSAPGTMIEKTEVLSNSANYIGQYVTVEFSAYTNAGVPFHPVATRFRIEE